MTDSDNTKIIRLGQLNGFKGFSDALLSKMAIITSLATMSAVAQSTSVITNDEWKLAYTDSEDRVLFGITQENEWKLLADVDEILDCIISSFPTDSTESTT